MHVHMCQVLMWSSILIYLVTLLTGADIEIFEKETAKTACRFQVCSCVSAHRGKKEKEPHLLLKIGGVI